MYGCLWESAKPYRSSRGGSVLWHGPSSSISPGKLRLMPDVSKPLATVSPLGGSIGYLAFALKWCSSSLGKPYSLLTLVTNLQEAWTSPVTVQHAQETPANTGPWRTSPSADALHNQHSKFYLLFRMEELSHSPSLEGCAGNCKNVPASLFYSLLFHWEMEHT